MKAFSHYSKERIIYAILIAGILHLVTFLFFFFYNIPSPPIFEEFQEVEIELVTDSYQEEDDIQQEGDIPVDQIKSVAKNVDDKRSTSTTDFTKAYNDQLEESIRKDLSKIQNDILKSRKDAGLVPKEYEKKKVDPADKETSKNNSSDPSKNTFGGYATSTYSLNGRGHVRKIDPAYKCLGGGQVKVLIEVDRAGKVLSAKVQKNSSVIEDCLYEQAKIYAMKWKFQSAPTSPQIDKGYILFTYIPKK